MELPWWSCGEDIAFLGGSAGKESACSAGDPGLIPGLRGSPGEGKDYPIQCSGLDNSTDCIVHGATKSWTRLSDFHFPVQRVQFRSLVRAKIPHASQPKNQTINQKQYCNKFDTDFKNGPHQKDNL